jgi:serine/threonine protein kinase
MVDVERRTILADRYELECVLGRGALAEVWRARDTVLERKVAVKLFDPTAWATASGRARFQTEARVAASLSHPNLVTVHDFGIDECAPFLVMQLMDGPTLADEIAAGPLHPHRLVAVMRHVLAGLDAAHARGVLHRDIKPGNVLFAGDDRAVLADFGIATTDDPAGLTLTGMVIGTPAYLAPERLAEMPATVRTDLYAVGVMAYEALAGRPPFTGDSPLAIAYAVHHAPVPPLREVRPEVPPALASVVARAMARPPEERFESASELADAFAGSLARNPEAEPTLAMAAVPAVAPTRTLPVVPRPPRQTMRRFSIPVEVAMLAAVAVMAVLALRHDPEPAVPTQNNQPTVTTLAPGLEQLFTDLDEAVDQ